MGEERLGSWGGQFLPSTESRYWGHPATQAAERGKEVLGLGTPAHRREERALPRAHPLPVPDPHRPLPAAPARGGVGLG